MIHHGNQQIKEDNDVYQGKASKHGKAPVSLKVKRVEKTALFEQVVPGELLYPS